MAGESADGSTTSEGSAEVRVVRFGADRDGPTARAGAARVARFDAVGVADPAGAAESPVAVFADADGRDTAHPGDVSPSTEVAEIAVAEIEAAEIGGFAGEGSNGPAPVAEFDIAVTEQPVPRTARLDGLVTRGQARTRKAPSRRTGPDEDGGSSENRPGRRAGRRGEPGGAPPLSGVADPPGRRRRRPGEPVELDPDADPVVVAREICLRLLSDRARTRQELAQTLGRKGVPDEAALTVLERFDEVGLIDDAAFAGQWVRARHTHRGLARRAIAQELRRKGVADEVAGDALAEVDLESEERRARELVDRKLRTMPASTPDERVVAGRRLVGMLARKGYGGSTVYRVVREALTDHGADTDELGAEPVDD